MRCGLLLACISVCSHVLAQALAAVSATQRTRFFPTGQHGLRLLAPDSLLTSLTRPLPPRSQPYGQSLSFNRAPPWVPDLDAPSYHWLVTIASPRSHGQTYQARLAQDDAFGLMMTSTYLSYPLVTRGYLSG
jgi:hypothetical protein